jgi:hypothetical protein
LRQEHLHTAVLVSNVGTGPFRAKRQRAAVENDRGKQLPPPAALEREMESLGVIASTTERARQVFQRSAETAGYFEMNRTRLIMPAGPDELPPPEDKKDVAKKAGGNGCGDDLLPGGRSDHRGPTQRTSIERRGLA